MNYEELITKIRETHRLKDSKQRFFAMLPLMAWGTTEAPLFVIKYVYFYIKQAEELKLPDWKFKLENTIFYLKMHHPNINVSQIEQKQTPVLDYISNLHQQENIFEYYLSVAVLFFNISLVQNYKEGARQALKNLQKVAYLVQNNKVSYNQYANYNEALMSTLLFIEQYETALQCVEQQLAAIPDLERYRAIWTGTMLTKIEILICLQQTDTALQHVETLQQNPKILQSKRAYCYYLQGWIWWVKKKVETAIEYLYISLETGKHVLTHRQKIDIYTLLTKCFEHKKDYQQALKCEKQANALEIELQQQNNVWLYKFWYQMLEKYSIADGITYTIWENWAQVQQSQNNQEQQFIKKMLENLQQQIGNKSYGVQELALDMDMSERQLSRKIIQHFGIPPLQLMRQIRVDLAKQMLSAKMWTVQEIADYLGFSSASYFIRTFKEAAGCTPSEYAP